MTKIGIPLTETLRDSGFDKSMTRPFEGLNQSEVEQQTGYSYEELVENMESLKAKEFTTTIAFSSTDYNTVTWAAGNVEYQDGLVTPEIATSNTGNMTARTYIYYDPQASKVALQTTTTASTATKGDRIMLAIAVPNATTTKMAEVQTFGSTGMYIGNLSVEHLTAGSIRSKAITLSVTAGTGDSKIQAGKSDFTNTDSGFILGIDDSDSDKAKFYIGDATNYLNWTGSALNIAGAITGSTVDIGGADATSFHVDTSGNMWLGASTFASAPCKVSSAGALTATSVTIKDSGDTTIIDATGLVSSANFASDSVENSSARTYSNAATYADIANTSITTSSLARSTEVLILYTVNVIEFPINGTTAFAGKVTLRIDSTDQTGNNFELQLTSLSPIANTSAWGGPLTAVGIVTLASGTHTLKLRAQTINTNSQLNVNTTSLVYIVLGT